MLQNLWKSLAYPIIGPQEGSQLAVGFGELGGGDWVVGGRCQLSSMHLLTVLTLGVLEELFDDGGCQPIIFKSREPQMLLSHL